MKSFLQKRSGRHGYDGWGVQIGSSVLHWTVSTTREEARQVIKDRPDVFGSCLFGRPKVVKVKLWVETVT